MSATSTDPRRFELASRLLVMLLTGIFLLGLLGFAVAVLDADEERAAPGPPSRPDLATAAPLAAPRILLAVAGASGSPAPVAAADPSAPAATPDPSAPAAADPVAAADPSAVAATPDPSIASAGAQVSVPMTEQVMPVVPVARFWSTREDLARRDIVRALETGRLRGFRSIVADERLYDALATTLDIVIHPDVGRGDLEEVRRTVRRGGLGLLPASDLAASLRTLSIDGRSLLGNERIRDVADWPLLVSQRLAEGEGWDQAQTWVLVAGGDAFTDRGVYDTVVRKGRGVDYPFDGGTARVTGHGCCDPVFNDNVVPRYVLTGGQGAVRRLFKDAELAIANHEMPTTEAWGFHPSGLRFSGRPDLTRVFTRAGIDWLSLANNHIKDYGTEGVTDTRRILR